MGVGRAQTGMRGPMVDAAGRIRTSQYILDCRVQATPSSVIVQGGVATLRTDFDNRCFPRDCTPGFVIMARWPRHVWTSIFTYAIIFLLFPALCLLAYAWVQQWIF